MKKLIKHILKEEVDNKVKKYLSDPRLMKII